MTWFSTWRERNNTPAYAAHATESAAAEHAKSKRAGGMQATHFWSEATEENAG